MTHNLTGDQMSVVNWYGPLECWDQASKFHRALI